MSGYVLSAAAELDLDEIWGYIAADSLDAADRWIGKLCLFHRCRVGDRAAMRGHGDNGSGLHIHCILRFVSQRRAPVFQLCDLRFAVARTLPVFVGGLLPALAVHAAQCRPVRGIHAFGFGDSLQIPVVAFACIAPHNRLHRRVGFQRRRIHSDGLTLNQAALRQPLQHPGEDPLMGLRADQPPRPRYRHVVRRLLIQSDAEKLSQRERISQTPSNVSFRQGCVTPVGSHC